MRTILSCAAILLLAACGRDVPEPQAVIAGAALAAPAPAATDATYQERLRALAPGARDAALLRAVRDAGVGCEAVATSEYLGTAHGHASWLTQCGGGERWLVTVGGDDTARVMSLADAHRTHMKRGTGRTDG
jgi:hypothetical protein